MFIEDPRVELVLNKNGTNSLPSGPVYYQYYKSLNPAASPYVAVSLISYFLQTVWTQMRPNSLDQYQAQQNVLPELDKKCLTMMVFLN